MLSSELRDLILPLLKTYSHDLRVRVPVRLVKRRQHISLELFTELFDSLPGLQDEETA